MPIDYKRKCQQDVRGREHHGIAHIEGLDKVSSVNVVATAVLLDPIVQRLEFLSANYIGYEKTMEHEVTKQGIGQCVVFSRSVSILRS